MPTNMPSQQPTDAPIDFSNCTFDDIMFLIDSSNVFFDGSNDDEWQAQQDFLGELVDLAYNENQRLSYLKYSHEVAIELDFTAQQHMTKEEQVLTIKNNNPIFDTRLPNNLTVALIEALRAFDDFSLAGRRKTLLMMVTLSNFELDNCDDWAIELDSRDIDLILMLFTESTIDIYRDLNNTHLECLFGNQMVQPIDNDTVFAYRSHSELSSNDVFDVISERICIHRTDAPTVAPTVAPTISTASPSDSPSSMPTLSPSFSPTLSPIPSEYPTVSPTLSPSISPTFEPSLSPTLSSLSPSLYPTSVTEPPSNAPSGSPSISPSSYTLSPSHQPSGKLD